MPDFYLIAGFSGAHLPVVCQLTRVFQANILAKVVPKLASRQPVVARRPLYNWCPLNPSTYFFSGNADAISSFGSLGAFAAGLANCTATGINCGEPEGNVTAGASFEDLIKITNGPASGFLDFAIQTSGSGSAICSASVPVACANSFAGAQLAITSNELIDGLHQSGIGLTNGVSSHDVRIAFTSSGGIASVDFDLGLIAFIRCSVDNIRTDCTASSDFIDTAQVTGVTVLTQTVMS